MADRAVHDGAICVFTMGGIRSCACATPKRQQEEETQMDELWEEKDRQFAVAQEAFGSACSGRPGNGSAASRLPRKTSSTSRQCPTPPTKR